MENGGGLKKGLVDGNGAELKKGLVDGKGRS
jgi:hypothetical protein